MADYPDTIYEPRELENLQGCDFDADKKKILFAEDYNNLANEVVAIETVLGENPQGTFDTVAERLDNIVSGSPAIFNWYQMF